MAEPYLRELRSLLERLSPGGAVECKHFFGGAAAYSGGRIFMSLTKVGLALKLPAETRNRLFQDGATPLRYFPKAPVKKEYAVLREATTQNEAALARLIGESLDYSRNPPGD